jgi:polyphosphate glucokinase
MEQDGRLSRTLVIDIGGTNIKVRSDTGPEVRKFPSGPRMTPTQMVSAVAGMTADWELDRISIGYPGVVIRNKITAEPPHLGVGWTGFDFAAAFGKPVRIINDAAMQALGSYEGGHMLFLGLGTGLGSALILDGVLQPLELGRLPYRKGRTYEEYVGVNGRRRLGTRRWRAIVLQIIDDLTKSLLPDYVVLGGGEVKRMPDLPPNCRRGSNAAAFEGGFKLWEPSTPSVRIRDPLRNGA